MPCHTLQLGCAGVLDTWDNLYSFFLERVRNKLHVCLCFSPVGVKFSRRAQQFPGLINGCTIDWFLSWPEEALTSVSGKFIDEFSMACPDTVKDSLKLMMGAVHVNVTAACQVRRLPPGVLVTLLYGSSGDYLACQCSLAAESCAIPAQRSPSPAVHARCHSHAATPWPCCASPRWAVFMLCHPSAALQLTW